MRKTLPLLAAVVLSGAILSGCASAERKLGRGMSNTFEVVRLGEMRRTVEQTALFESPETAYTTGVIKGLNRTLARTGVGIYEIVTFPLPPYEPVLTSYLSPGPVYPDSYRPGLIEGSTFSTDTSIGFAGGDIAQMIPGSRFHIFDTH
jgi:putative exosortase-associated protein (TIGR04073 family)